VIGPVLAAFRCAGLTSFCTDAAKILGELRSATHKCCGIPAQLSAVSIQPNALGHLFHVGLAEAGICTMFACFGAGYTGLDTCLVFRLIHESLLLWGVKKFVERAKSPQAPISKSGAGLDAILRERFCFLRQEFVAIDVPSDMARSLTNQSGTEAFDSNVSAV
jgi:hypothetical protein